MAVEFYDVKTREKVQVAEDKLSKVKYENTTKGGKVQVRYALRGTLEDGRRVTKFVSQATWDETDVPIEQK
jgi:hypothetical protein